MRAAIEAFPPAALRAWCEGLGQPTFVGSSGRVFPRAMKASPLLRAWLRRLDAAGVRFALRHHWTGWDEEKRLTFAAPDGPIAVDADATVLALGGASWPRLGSDGGWADVLTQAGVACRRSSRRTADFWSIGRIISNAMPGQPLKRIALSFGDHTVRGEAIITESGIEGGAIYALSPHVASRRSRRAAKPLLRIALRPDMAARRSNAGSASPRGKQSLSTFLRKALSLSPAEIGLLQEATGGKLATLAPAELARLINAVPIRLTGIAPIARAISTAGGVAFGEIDERFMLRRLPGVFVAGEMLDWEAPTGGYLLQACFATGAAAGRGALEWLRSR